MYGGGGAWQNVLSKISCIMYNETIVYKSIKCEVQQELMKQHIGQSLYAYREQCSDSVPFLYSWCLHVAGCWHHRCNAIPNHKLDAYNWEAVKLKPRLIMYHF